MGGCGEPFTRFVDGLIRTHAFVYGIGEAEILTSLRTNIGDGGVDTQVRRDIPNDPTGYCLEATCWQYKAQGYADVSDTDLIKEINKPYAVKLLREGYAYRFAICDDMPPVKQTDWETVLTTEALKINPKAPRALVATASQLASWANRYPALLPAYFPHDPGPVQYFDAWTPNITKATPEFVPVEEWHSKAELIDAHINLINAVRNPIITLQGMAGVGKTRFVYEILKKLSGANNLVFYTADGDDAEVVARFLSNDKLTRGILVADECPVLSRAGISKALKGHTDRVRVVCIDNSGEHVAEEILWLDNLSTAIVERVLERNFTWVPPDRRRLYAAQSGGYIRLAADMCEYDADIQNQGHLGPALEPIQEYYRQRIPEDRQQRAVEAIALVQKVGFGEGVSDELEALCGFTGQTPDEVLEITRGLKDAPGFIARTTRYLYVTPEIIARLAFGRGWRRWFEHEPQAALRRIPSVLLESFQARVARSASSEVRALTGQFFWDSVASLTPADLATDDAVERLAVLIGTNPDQYFPRLALLVKNASDEQLKETKGELGQGGTRRRLVWTAENLAAFPEYFSQAEEILRRLALSENESGVGNNATGEWRNLFRIVLSGAATPFRERLSLLEQLIFSSNKEESTLALTALERTWDFMGTRLVGPSVFAGKLVPPDWRPTSPTEAREALEQVLALFSRVLERGSQDMKDFAWRSLPSDIRPLLGQGMLPELRSIYRRFPVPDKFLANTLESVEEFLQYECRAESGKVADDPYCQDVSQWLNELTPTDFDGRLRAVIGKEPWHHSLREDLSSIELLARELHADPSKMHRTMGYLNSSEARSAGLLGEAIARIDKEGSYLDAVLESASTSEALTLARGYVAGLIAAYPEHSEKLNLWLDRLEDGAPDQAYFLSLCAPESTNPTARTFRLIRQAKIPVHALQNLVYGTLLDQMPPEDFVAAIDLLIKAGDPRALQIAMEIVGRATEKRRAFTPAERDAVWRALAASAPVADRADHWWARTTNEFASTVPDHICDIALLALTGRDYHKRNQAWSVLASIGKSHPDLVMEKVARILVDPQQEWRLRSSVRGHLFQTLPLETVQRWLEATGVEGARCIANYLEPPFLDKQSEPRVPLLTEYVLGTWGGDDVVFRRFAASTHHLQMYSGDIAALHRQEAERGRAFLSHPIAAVRRWAEAEVALGEEQARQWTIRTEEQFME